MMVSKSRQLSEQEIQKFIDELGEPNGSEYSEISDDEEDKLNFYSFKVYERLPSSGNIVISLKIVG